MSEVPRMNDFLPSDQLVAHRAQLDMLQQEAVTLTGELSTAQAQYDDIIANAVQQTGEEEARRAAQHQQKMC